MAKFTDLVVSLSKGLGKMADGFTKVETQAEYAQKATEAYAKKLREQVQNQTIDQVQMDKLIREHMDKLDKAGQRLAATSTSLHDTFEGLDGGLSTTEGSLDGITRAHVSYGKRLKEVGGPLSDIQFRLTKMRHEMAQAGAQIGQHQGGWGKLGLSMAATLKGLSMMVSGLNQAVKAVEQYSYSYADQAKVAMRGSALMKGSTEAMRQNQFTVSQNAKFISGATGASVTESTNLSAKLLESLDLSGQQAVAVGSRFNAFSESVSRSGKLAGLSTDAIGAFSQSLMVNSHMSARTTEDIFRMIRGVNQFGLSGTKAVEVLSEAQDQILGMSSNKGRKEFSRMLLESAASFTKAGVDFKKYAGDLAGKKGMDALKGAAMVSSLSGGQHSVFDVQRLMRSSRAADKAELMGLQQTSMAKLGGMTMNQLGSLKKLHERFSVDPSSLNAKENAEYQKLRDVMEEQIKNQGSHVGFNGDFNTLMSEGDQAKRVKEAATEVGTIQPGSKKDLKEQTKQNLTSSEITQADLANYVAKKFGPNVDEKLVQIAGHLGAIQTATASAAAFLGGLAISVTGIWLTLRGLGGGGGSGIDGIKKLLGKGPTPSGSTTAESVAATEAKTAATEAKAAAQGVKAAAAETTAVKAVAETSKALPAVEAAVPQAGRWAGMLGKGKGLLGGAGKLAAKWVVPVTAAVKVGKTGLWDGYQDVKNRKDLNFLQKTHSMGMGVLGTAFDTLSTLDPTGLLGFIPGVHMEKGFLKAATNKMGITKEGEELGTRLRHQTMDMHQGFNETASMYANRVNPAIIEERGKAIHALILTGHRYAGDKKDLNITGDQIVAWYKAGAKPDDLKQYAVTPPTPVMPTPPPAPTVTNTAQKDDKALPMLEQPEITPLPPVTATQERLAANAQGTAKTEDFKKLGDKLGEILQEFQTLSEILQLNSPAGNPNYA